MTDADQNGNSTESQSVRPHVVRRRYLIDRKRQLRTTMLTTSLVAVLLILVNLGFTLLRNSQTSLLSSAAPQLTPVLERQDSTSASIMIVISVVLLAAVAYATIHQTHRTAGAVYAVKQRIERVAAGDFQVRLKLRQNDNLQDLETPFNDMVGSLRDRALVDADALDELAATADRLGPVGTALASSLHELAGKKRQLGS
jgi:methyl-accepting chemotaxis protein